MALPGNVLLKVVSTWPVVQDELFDPTMPSPWSNITVVQSPDPLKPDITILFSHAIDPSVYANNTALSSYFFITSLTNPSEPNIQSFENVTWDSNTNVLNFRPSVELTPGSTYWATVMGNLKDAYGRLIQAPYSWSFEIDASLSVGTPVPQVLSPPDQSIVLDTFFPIIWGLDPSYSPPSGDTLSFDIRIATDINMKQLVYEGNVLSMVSHVPPTGTALSTYKFYPLLPASGLVTPQQYYVSLRSNLTDASGNSINVSLWTSPVSFYYDNSGNSVETASTTPGQDTFPPILQTDPLIPVQAFMVTGISPPAGFVSQDTTTNVQPIYIYPFGYF